MGKNIFKETKNAFGVLDVFLIVLIIVSAVGIAARFVLTEENGILATKPETEDAVLSVLVSDIEGTSEEYFVSGCDFMISEYETSCDVVSDFTVTPAQYYVENENGELVISYHDEENGHVDCRGALKVSGFYKDGVYILGGKYPVTAGMTVTLINGKITVSALITDVAPLS